MLKTKKYFWGGLEFIIKSIIFTIVIAPFMLFSVIMAYKFLPSKIPFITAKKEFNNEVIKEIKLEQEADKRVKKVHQKLKDKQDPRQVAEEFINDK